MREPGVCTGLCARACVQPGFLCALTAVPLSHNDHALLLATAGKGSTNHKGKEPGACSSLSSPYLIVSGAPAFTGSGPGWMLGLVWEAPRWGKPPS